MSKNIWERGFEMHPGNNGSVVLRNHHDDRSMGEMWGFTTVQDCIAFLEGEAPKSLTIEDGFIDENGFAKEPDDNDWIEWNGGECPVEDTTRVQVRYQGGAMSTGTAQRYSWGQWPTTQRPITAYRLTKADGSK